MAQKFDVVWGAKSLSQIQWQQLLSDGAMDAGSNGNGVTAYNVSAWAMRAVALRSQAVAGAPLMLRRGDEEVIEKHPVLDLLYQVDSEWDYGQLMQHTEASLLTYGAAYWYKARPAPGGRVTQLVFLSPANCTLEMDTVNGGIKALRVSTTQSGQRRVKEVLIPRADFVYFRGEYNPADPLRGIAPLRYALISALGERHADRYLNAFFENYATVPLALVTDQSISEGDAERVKSKFTTAFAGAMRAFRVMVLGNGLKLQQMGSTPKDIELAGVRAAMHQTISTALGVPELLISPSNAADLTPVKMAQTLFYQNTIVPRWSMLAEAITSQLVSEFPDLRGAWVEFDDSNIAALGEDETNKAQRLALMVQIGALTPQAAGREMGYADEDIPLGVDVAGIVEGEQPATLTDAPENIVSSPALNGSQVTSAVGILTGLAQGGIAEAAAEELLLALGIAPERVQRMVQATNRQRIAIVSAAASGDSALPRLQLRSVGMAGELEKWQRKALAAVERGKSPAVPFAGEYISPVANAALKAALEAAEDADDVRGIFRDLFEWGKP